MTTVPEKLSMEGKGLRNKLTIIASLLFLLPSFVILYILYEENISLRSDNSYLVLIGLTLVLALAGLIILRKVFNEFILLSGYMKKAEAGEMYMMEVQKSTAELHDISVSFNNLMRKLEVTTKRLEDQASELKEETIKRKRAEEGLLLMVKAVENTKTGITFADRDNVIRYTNPAEAKMHGYAQEELIGKSVRVFSPPGMGRPIAFEDMNAIKGWARESLNIKKDGSIFPVYLMSDLVKNDDGEPIGIVTICEDMTESKRVQKELEEAYAHVFHTGRLSQLGEMAMGIAREINLLLNSISRTNHSMLVDTKDGKIPSLPVVERSLNKIDNQIARVKDIIEHLRVFSRKETGSSHFHLIDVADSVKGALLLIEEQLKVRDIGVEMHFPPDFPDVLANPSWIEQVFLNLMTNARDAMENQPRNEKQVLSIRGRKNPDGGITIDVSDTGSGIPREVRDKIFDSFFTTKEPDRGTGLGLAISRGIIKEHGGDLTLEPQEGKGSTFRITLPPVE